MIVVIGKIGESWDENPFDLFPNGDTQLALRVTTRRMRKMAGRGLPTNNIPAVMAAAAGYIYYVQ